MNFDHGIPVTDERPIRVAAGILFGMILIAMFSFMRSGDFTPIYAFVAFISTDLLIRIFLKPDYSPTVAIGKLFVRGGQPHWIGLPQKKFAWSLGLLLATVMVSSTLLIGQRNPLASLACMGCLLLLMYESVFGVCVGCTFYGKLFPNKPTVCPDGSCEIKVAK